MGYIPKSKRKGYLLAGFFAMLLCGISDCMLSYMGEGEPFVLAGMISVNIVKEPLWYYQASFVIGIIASVGYLLASRSACFYILDRQNGDRTGLYKAFSFGTTMMSVGIFGIHSICCMALMNVRAALLAGAFADSIAAYFTQSALVPFMVGTIWQTTADLISGIAFIVLVARGKIAVPKFFIVIGPLSLYAICKVAAAVLTTVTGNTLFSHVLGGGESWGIAMMFLAFYIAVKKEK